MDIEQKLPRIFSFLAEHRCYNKRVQESFYKSYILPHDNTPERVIFLLYKIANTQSQPKINKLATFYKRMYRDIEALQSFSGFVCLISGDDNASYEKLFTSLKEQSGWGPKTSALFVKSIYHLHNGDYDARLNFWSDAPQLMEQDKLYLPVDVVITEIFKKLESKNWSFNSINSIIHKHYAGEAVEVWDDLWFWGFLTQKVIGGQRHFEWNENKYWALEHSSKNVVDISKIRSLSNEFIQLIQTT